MGAPNNFLLLLSSTPDQGAVDKALGIIHLPLSPNRQGDCQKGRIVTSASHPGPQLEWRKFFGRRHN